jgi:hypothetical protein
MAVARALAASSDDLEALARMGLASPQGIAERLEAKLVALGLGQTRQTQG